MHARSRPVRTAALLACGLLAACGAMKQREGGTTERERYLYYAGAPVSSFSTHGRMDSWQPLGRNELIVWTRFNDAYWLKVEPTCHELDTAFRISLESRVSGTITRGFDWVRVDGHTCRIMEIRPIDYKQMRRDERELREGRAPARPEPPAEESKPD